MNSNAFDLLITCYMPPDSFRQKICNAAMFCRYIVVVDNTPGSAFLNDLPQNVRLISTGENLGLARALNFGVEFLKSLKSQICIFFDQDTSIDVKILNSLINRYNYIKSLGFYKSIVGPKPLDDAKLYVAGSNNASCVEVSCLQTSGMLVPLHLIPDDVNFNEDFFLDFVDYDYCWRLNCVGWHIYLDNSIVMPHRLGYEEKKFLGVVYHVPAPYRHYFQFRDGLNILFTNYAPWCKRIRLFIILAPKFLIYPIIMDRGLERLRWMLLGIFDFIRRVKGVGSAYEKLCVHRRASFKHPYSE